MYKIHRVKDVVIIPRRTVTNLSRAELNATDSLKQEMLNGNGIADEDA